MILIIGGNHDDVLYFESIARDAKEEIILNKYHATIGSIFNQNVLILKDVYTSYLSSALCMHIMEKYHVLITVCVGKCRTLSKDLRCGDIVISDKVVFGDVDQTGSVKGTKLGEIPGFKAAFYANPHLVGLINDALDKIGRARHFEATFLSSSVYTLDYTDIDRFLETLEVKGPAGEIVVDDNSAGVAMAAELMDIPCVSVKIIESKAEEEPSVDTYLRVLKQYAVLGKAVVSAIGEIGRNDVLRQGANYGKKK